MPRSHLVIPDTQIGPGRSTKYLGDVAKYARSVRPDHIIMLGDWGDFSSIGTFDRGKLAGEGRRLIEDIKVASDALYAFTEALPRAKLWFLTGNHEYRLHKYVNEHPELAGMLSFDAPRRAGWRVAPFLTTVKLDETLYCHYFPHNAKGEVKQERMGAPSARTQVQRLMQSCVAGHNQGLDIGYHSARGKQLTGVIAGSCYTHNEHYHPGCGHNYWRGIVHLKNVRSGEFDLSYTHLDNL